MSLKELYRRAITFPGPDIPLAGLHTALKAVEEELTHASAQATVRLQARHKRDADSIHPDDRDLDLYELDVTVKQIFPRVFRGGFVLTLWSVFEVVVKRMAEYVSRERGLPAVQPEFRIGNFLNASDRVYANLGIVAFPDATIRDQIDQLRHIRNALIHHNGSTTALQESMGALEPDNIAALGLETYSDTREVFFIPTADFLSRNFTLVQTYLTSLSERAYTAAHPVPLEDSDT